ncbi:MAG: DUF1080 domain-containing protein [Verrucomicrobiota bacterium]|jgi:hypothetical protein
MRHFPLWILLVIALANRAAGQDEAVPDLPPVPTRENQVALFNGRDFSGFAFCMLNDANPRQTWSVTNGVIHCTGNPLGYLRTTQSYSNYFLTVEWRFVKVAPKADHTGILVHLQLPDQIWPKCIKVQGKHDRVGDLFLLAGADSKEHKGMGEGNPVPFRESRENPVGQWNTSETVCIHNTVVCFLNGYFVNETTETTLNDGFIGIQCEGGEIEIRAIHFSPLKY